MKFDCIINISNILDKSYEGIIVDKIKSLLQNESYFFIFNNDLDVDLNLFIIRNKLSNFGRIIIKSVNEDDFVWYRISNYTFLYNYKINYRYSYITDGSENSLLNALDNFYNISNFVINKVNKKNELQHRNNSV